MTVIDATTLAFPIYDENGMFLSMGNIAETGKISTEDPLMTKYPGAQLIVKAKVEKVFFNCARLIHKHQRVAASPYVPDHNGETPFPAWKRIDLVQDVLPPKDLGKATSEGGVITQEEYGAKLAIGES